MQLQIEMLLEAELYGARGQVIAVFSDVVNGGVLLPTKGLLLTFYSTQGLSE